MLAGLSPRATSTLSSVAHACGEMPGSSVASTSQDSQRSDNIYSGNVQQFDDILFNLTTTFEQLKRRRVRGGNATTAAAAAAQMQGNRRGSNVAAAAAESAASALGADSKEPDDVNWFEAVQHLNIMLASAKLDVRLRACRSVAEMGESSAAAKEEICASDGMIRKLVAIMKSYGLEAITALSVLTTDHVRSCDLAREAGAIPILVAFINKDWSKLDVSDNSNNTPDGEEISLLIRNQTEYRAWNPSELS